MEDLQVGSVRRFNQSSTQSTRKENIQKKREESLAELDNACLDKRKARERTASLNDERTSRRRLHHWSPRPIYRVECRPTRSRGSWLSPIWRPESRISIVRPRDTRRGHNTEDPLKERQSERLSPDKHRECSSLTEH